MKYAIINSSGTVTASGSTDATGGGSTTSKSELGPWTFWSPSNDCPTSYTNMTYPIVSWNSSSAAQMNGGLKMPSSGYVNGLATTINGQTGGTNVSMQVYKNGSALGIVTTGSVPNNGPAANYSAAGGSSYTFAAGDVLSVYIQAAASGINQSFAAFLELVLNN